MSGLGSLSAYVSKTNAIWAQSLQSDGAAAALILNGTPVGFWSKPFAARALLSDGHLSSNLWRTNSNWPQSLSSDHVSAALFWNEGNMVKLAYSDIATSVSESILQLRSVICTPKEYHVNISPLFSMPVLSWRTLILFIADAIDATLRYLVPHLEPQLWFEDDEEKQKNKIEDWPTRFKEYAMLVFGEITSTYISRIQQMLVLYCFPQRMAWKLLKDASSSALRKSLRGMPRATYIFSVSRTTFIANLVGITSVWLASTGVEVYRYISCVNYIKEDVDDKVAFKRERAKLLRRRLIRKTFGCGTSLVCSALVAGICSAVFHPKSGQLIGCIIGSFIAPPIMLGIFG